MYVSDVEDFDDEEKDETREKEAIGTTLQNPSLMTQSVHFENSLRNAKTHFVRSTPDSIHTEDASLSDELQLTAAAATTKRHINSKNVYEKKSLSSLMYNYEASLKTEDSWKNDRESKENNGVEGGESGLNSGKHVISFQSTSGEYSVSKSSNGELLILVNGKLFRHVKEDDDIEHPVSPRTPSYRKLQPPTSRPTREKCPCQCKDMATVDSSLSNVQRSIKRDEGRYVVSSDIWAEERRRQSSVPIDQPRKGSKTQMIKFEDWSHDGGQVEISKTSKSLDSVEPIRKLSGRTVELKSSSSKQRCLCDDSQEPIALDCHQRHQYENQFSSKRIEKEQITSEEKHPNAKFRDSTCMCRATECRDIAYRDTKCRDTKCRDTKCRDTKCRDTKCRDTKCRDTKCRDNKCRDTKCRDNKCRETKCRGTEYRLHRTASSICGCDERYRDECDSAHESSDISQRSDKYKFKCHCDNSVEEWQLRVAEPPKSADVDSGRKKGGNCGCKSKAERNILSNVSSRTKGCDCGREKHIVPVSDRCGRLGPFGSIPRSSALAGKRCCHSSSRGSSCCSNNPQSICSDDFPYPQPLRDCPDTRTCLERPATCKEDLRLKKVPKASDVSRRQRGRPIPAACSQQYRSTVDDPTEPDGSVIIRSLLVDKNDHPNLQMIGEIAGQLESRIVQYVFAGLDRKSSYGILVRNIPEVIEISCFDRDAGKINVPLQFRLVKRFAYVKTSLRPFGYNFAFHPQFSIDMVNKYGRLDVSKDQTMFSQSAIDLEARKDLATFIQTNCSPSEAEHVNILLDSLLLLASDDGKSLFIWQQK